MKLAQRQKLFQKPSREFRGKPFWSWNGKLEEKELKRQIDIMKEMGFGGFFMHSRTGLETEYLGEDWFHLINSCAEYGSKKGMETWLYDEDRWPSGSAGGMVTKEPQYRAMFLEMNQFSSGEWNDFLRTTDTAAVFACRIRDGIFTGKRRLYEGDVPQEEETVLEFRTRYSACNDNYNGFCYVNTMNREAIDKYIESTHEKYRKNCGDRLGTEIQGIFTDEPHRGGVFTNFAEGEENAVPYTPAFLKSLKSASATACPTISPNYSCAEKKRNFPKSQETISNSHSSCFWNASPSRFPTGAERTNLFSPVTYYMRIPSAARLSCRAHLCVSMNIWTILVWICLPRATNATG